MTNASVNMAASLGITSTEPRELKIGASFGNQGPLYHTLRYDFKPASVDAHKVATVEVNEKNPKEVMVTVPHTDGAGTPYTVFKGNQCPVKRDCVLIINKTTGEMTLEKLHTSITVKKTRFESTSSKLGPPIPDPLSLGRKASPKHRGKASPKPSSLGCIPKHSPLHASPNPSLPMIGEDIDPGYDDPRPTSQASKSSTDATKRSPDLLQPDRDANHAKSSKAMGQMPKRVLGVNSRNARERDGGYDNSKAPASSHKQSPKQSSPEISFSFESKEPPVNDNQVKPGYDELHTSLLANDIDNTIGVLSDSSSDSGSESESSDSSSEAEKPIPKASPPAHNGSGFPSAQGLLSEDLQLSDSGSDSD